MVGAWKVIPLVVVSYGVGLGIEFLFAGMRGHSINEGYLVSGMLIPLIMPVDVPLWMVALAVAFAVVVAKEVFGGTGMNILNVALTARAFLFFAYPKQLSGEIWIHDVATSKPAVACSSTATPARRHWATSQHRLERRPGGSQCCDHVHVRGRRDVLPEQLLLGLDSRLGG